MCPQCWEWISFRCPLQILQMVAGEAILSCPNAIKPLVSATYPAGGSSCGPWCLSPPVGECCPLVGVLPSATTVSVAWEKNFTLRPYVLIDDTARVPWYADNKMQNVTLWWALMGIVWEIFINFLSGNDVFWWILAHFSKNSTPTSPHAPVVYAYGAGWCSSLFKRQAIQPPPERVQQETSFIHSRWQTVPHCNTKLDCPKPDTIC